MSDLRLFTGIAIHESVAAKLEETLRRLRPLAPLHWSPAENFHVTVKFVGAWPDSRLDELIAALQSFPAPEAFDISVRGLGFFPDSRRPRFLFAGIHAGPELAALNTRTEAALAPAGIEPEKRRYNPHLTLGRVRNENLVELKKKIQSMPEIDFGTSRITEFHLFRSVTSPRGSVYSRIASFPLGLSAGLSVGLLE